MAHARHIPERTCIGCGRKAAKRELVRIVRTPSGEVVMDPTGREGGRGSYLCPQPSCWEAALRKGRLAHALRAPIPVGSQQALREYARSLREAYGQRRG